MKKLMFALVVFFQALPALAQEAATEVAQSGLSGNAGIVALAAGLAIGIAAFGGALGQAKTAVSALDGIARNPAAQPKIFVPMIIGLALIESLVIYAFVISFLMVGKF